MSPLLVLRIAGRGAVRQVTEAGGLSGEEPRKPSFRNAFLRYKTGMARPRKYPSNAARQRAYRRRKRRSIHFSSRSVEWSTPQGLFNALDAEFRFETDVCATRENAKCSKYWTREDDGLSRHWEGVCWMNPPYREVAVWVRKAWESALAGATVVCLVPSRTDTRMWHEFVQGKAEVRFIRGRLKFGGHESSAPFPSAVLVYRPD
jgi:phage N-6-adenine-methyltransferase